MPLRLGTRGVLAVKLKSTHVLPPRKHSLMLLPSSLSCLWQAPSLQADLRVCRLCWNCLTLRQQEVETGSQGQTLLSVFTSALFSGLSTPPYTYCPNCEASFWICVCACVRVCMHVCVCALVPWHQCGSWDNLKGLSSPSTFFLCVCCCVWGSLDSHLLPQHWSTGITDTYVTEADLTWVLEIQNHAYTS